jgi:hypothetical protein
LADEDGAAPKDERVMYVVHPNFPAEEFLGVA